MGEDESGRGGFSSAAWWLLAVPAAYFGLLTAILIDEVVLKTFWFSKTMPGWVQRPIIFIYTPLIWLLEALGIA